MAQKRSKLVSRPPTTTRVMVGVVTTGGYFGHFVKIKKGVVLYNHAVAERRVVQVLDTKVEIWLIPLRSKFPDPLFLAKILKIATFTPRTF